MFPEKFAKEVLNQTWWEKQIELAHLIRDHDRVAVKSGHSTGKTHSIAGIAIWYFCCFENAQVITTAPSSNQVTNQIWKEIRKQSGMASQKLPNGLLPKKPEWYLNADWFMRGVCTDKGERFRGEHAENLLIIMDEANGVPAFVHEEAANMCTAPGNKIVMIGNPVSPDGEFYQAFNREDTVWKTLTISSMDHPNVVYGRQIFKGAVSRSWVSERVQKFCTRIEETDKDPTCFEWPKESGIWYKPSPQFMGRVLGEFPMEGPNSLFSLHHLNQARTIEIPLDVTATIDLGVDVARMGGDYSVIYTRQGPCVLARDRWQNRDTVFCAGRVAKMIQEYTEHGLAVGTVAVDSIGVGAGVADNLIRMKEEGIIQCERVLAIQVSEKANNTERFDIKRTEIAFAFADRVKNGQLDISRLPETAQDDLIFQSTNIKYGYTTRGQYTIESKDKYRDVVGISPDDFDALCLSFVDMVDTFVEDYIATMCV